MAFCSLKGEEDEAEEERRGQRDAKTMRGRKDAADMARHVIW